MLQKSRPNSHIYMARQAVIERAKAEFAKFREVRERIEKFTATVAACLLLSYEELDGTMILEKRVYNEIKERDGLIGGKSSYDIEGRIQAATAKASPDAVAISCMPDHRIAQWTLEQAQEWLKAVAAAIGHSTANESYVNLANAAVGVYIQDMQRELHRVQAEIGATEATLKTNGKGTTTNTNSRASLLFNTTTIKGRREKTEHPQSVLGKAATHKLKLPSGGHLLLGLRLRLKTLLEEHLKSESSAVALDEVASMFHAAIDSRVSFEEWQQKQARLATMEENRLRTEELMATKGNALGNKVLAISLATEQQQPTIEKVSEAPTAVAIKLEPSSQEQESEDLEALLGLAPVSNGGAFEAHGKDAAQQAIKRKASEPVAAASESVEVNKRIKVEPVIQFRIV